MCERYRWCFVCGGKSELQGDGYTALIYAAERGRAECVRLLIDAGADKEAKTDVCVGCFLDIFSPIAMRFVCDGDWLYDLWQI
jgi:hypothetical protein